MRKSEELVRGCMAKARDDEMTFVLLARDPAAPATIRFWCELREKMGKNCHTDAKILEAKACADIMENECGAIALGGTP